MDEIKSALAWTINTTTPDSLLTWDVNAFIGPCVDSSAPTLGHILQVATETKRAKEHNKIKPCVTHTNPFHSPSTHLMEYPHHSPHLTYLPEVFIVVVSYCNGFLPSAASSQLHITSQT
ncbi:hypothetical protein BS17DRAFT_416933 [Gyrodon lividus]|nr:hypothetical protein BS17DRAFT_416933 [Gyrodon lividus]